MAMDEEGLIQRFEIGNDPSIVSLSHDSGYQSQSTNTAPGHCLGDLDLNDRLDLVPQQLPIPNNETHTAPPRAFKNRYPDELSQQQDILVSQYDPMEQEIGRAHV